MATIIDNLELDETNIEFNYASDFVKHTDKIVYLTGKAGTGKTTFLKYLRETTTKNTVILAPTGVAAINAGGQTIHSFFQIKPSIYIPNDKRLRTKPDVYDTDKSTIFDHFKYSKDQFEIIMGLELLIIDEISMVRCDLLDVVDRLLRVFRKRENEVFGGVQVILIGDTFQLPPIAVSEQWDLLKDYYESPFFFSSKVIQQKKPIYIELKKIYRQNEQEFIDILNRVRINQITANELSLLNSKYNPTFSPNGNSNFITLATHNKIVESTNLTKLTELTTELKHFEATLIGVFPDNIMPTDRVLQLKEGAQVMFIKNDKGKRYYNGTIAKIIEILDNKIVAEYEVKGETKKIIVEKQEWNNIKYTWNEESKRIEEVIIGTFIQFPLKLAWAITVHKSQGLTFDKVIADLGAAFTSGQVYVALSRCTTFSGLVLKTRIEQNAIKTDSRVIQFAQNETPNTLIIQELNSGKADFYYRKLRESISSLDFNSAYENFIRALKFRNDIETEIFKRYFNVYASKLGLFKQKYFKLNNEFEQIGSKNTELQTSLNELNNIVLNFRNKNDEQNKSIKLLLEKTKEFEEIIENKDLIIEKINSDNTIAEELILVKQEEVKKQKTRISEFEKIIKSQKNDIQTMYSNQTNVEKTIKKYHETTLNLKRTILDLEEKLQRNELETLRLQNLKWYSKLLGKK